MLRRSAIFCLFVTVCGAVEADPPASKTVDSPPAARHVVLITMDGLPAYLFDDPSAVLTNIRSVADRGVRAEGMIVSNPSVTWPNHTTLVTGVPPARHGVLFNGVLERPGLGLPVSVNPRKDKVELVAVPTLFDAVHAAGRTAAEINWPCTRNAKSLAYSFPDSPEAWDHTTPALVEELKQAGVVNDDVIKDWSRLSGPARDRVWTQAACHVIAAHKPALLLVHLLNVDGTHHKHGPKSAPGYTAVAYADACIGEILKTIETAGIADETTVMITSDHGFIAIPKSLRPNVLLRQHELLTVRGKTVETARVHAVPEGGTALVYLTSPDTADADRQTVIELFESQEGIADVVTPNEYATYGLPTPGENRLAPDLVLAAKDGYGFSGDATGDAFVVVAEGTPGTHGFLSTNPKMNAAFVAAGAGIRPGATLGVFENVQVAPTIATLLGVELHGMDGEPLDAILSETKAAAR